MHAPRRETNICNHYAPNEKKCNHNYLFILIPWPLRFLLPIFRLSFSISVNVMAFFLLLSIRFSDWQQWNFRSCIQSNRICFACDFTHSVQFIFPYICVFMVSGQLFTKRMCKRKKIIHLSRWIGFFYWSSVRSVLQIFMKRDCIAVELATILPKQQQLRLEHHRWHSIRNIPYCTRSRYSCTHEQNK